MGVAGEGWREAPLDRVIADIARDRLIGRAEITLTTEDKEAVESEA
jgi:hypothetical protein